MKVNVGREGDRLSIEPETDFESQFLAGMFLNTSNRKVVVKSGSNPSDILCIDVVAQKTEVATSRPRE